MNPFSKDDKKFSICTPCYKNTYRHIEKFADMLNEQEYKVFEWINTFDGPSKKGEKAMKKVKEKYPEMDISWYTIKHGGACAARNNSAKYATGDFYCFTSPDNWLYPEALRMWANEFEDPKINRVWGMYDIVDDNGAIMQPVGQAAMRPDGSVWYPSFKWSPYADASFPIRATSFIPWDENCHSLNDWEWSIRLLAQNDYRGEDWKYVPHHFFSAETPQPGGLSYHSHNNWQSQSKYIQDKNGIDELDICVTSLGAQNHSYNISETLPAEYLTMPSYKPHNYKMVYLLGFYTREDPSQPGFVTRTHMDVFKRNKGKNVIHWIGTDVQDLFYSNSFLKLKELREWFKENNVIHLCECKHIQDELKEIGIDSKIVPLPPEKLYEPIPLPKEFTVGVYLPGREIYNEKLIVDVARSLPDIEFVFFGDESRKGQEGDNWKHVGYADYDKLIPTLSCNLRITTHDGLPLTPVQFMTAGRSVVTNVPLKGATVVEPKLEDIIKGVRKAQKEPIKASVAQYWKKEMDLDKYRKAIRRLI